MGFGIAILDKPFTGWDASWDAGPLQVNGRRFIKIDVGGVLQPCINGTGSIWFNTVHQVDLYPQEP